MGEKCDKKAGTKEEDCACYVESRTKKTCPPIRNVTHPLRYYEFTQEEIRALEECDVESFYQRCLPFSTLFATATYAAVKYGYLRRSPHWGVVPKTVMAASVGYVLGRVSYVPHCDRKLRKELPPGSYLGDTMRKYYAAANPPPTKK